MSVVSAGIELVKGAVERPAPIVVGLDGSEASLAALRWAADEAAAHQAPLVAVYVLDPRSRGRATYAHVGAVRSGDGDEAALVERMIAASGVERARQVLCVQRVFEVGIPSQVLTRVAIGARMLVLGHADHRRYRGGEGIQHGPALGPIARACVVCATCPVVVIPIPAQRPMRGVGEPEPRVVQVAKAAPSAGGRAIYPKRQPVPVVHG